MSAQEKVNMVEHEDHAVVYPQGYLNGPVGEAMDDACAGLLRRGLNRIVINFGQTETMNTMGVASLVSILEKTGRRGGVVCFSNLLSANRDALDALEISRAVLIFEDETAASQHLKLSER